MPSDVGPREPKHAATVEHLAAVFTTNLLEGQAATRCLKLYQEKEL